MKRSYLLLGTNLGDKMAFLAAAREHIQAEAGNIVRSSKVVQSAPWGFEHEEYFLNQVLEVDTDLTPSDLLACVLQIEEKMGRIRKAGSYEARNIDIDILLYEEQVIKEEGLSIPHPLLHERKFTLLPLQELIPDFIHPVLQQSIHTLLTNCPDPSEVTPLATDHVA